MLVLSPKSSQLQPYDLAHSIALRAYTRTVQWKPSIELAQRIESATNAMVQAATEAVVTASITKDMIFFDKIPADGIKTKVKELSDVLSKRVCYVL